MKNMVLAALAVFVCVSAQAKDLKCTNNGKEIGISVNENAKTLKITNGAPSEINFTIYETNTYQVEEGTVVSYSIKNGKDNIGFTLSGEVAILNDKKVGLTLQNDDLGKTILRIRSMDCK